MPTPKYDNEVYRQFAENLRTVLDGPNIKKVDLKDLRKPAIKTGQQTKFGSWGWRSSVSSRIGPKTVYLGSENVRLPNPSSFQTSIIESAPEELHKVLHWMRTLPIVHLRRQMGNNSEYNPICNLFMSTEDPKDARIAYMWGNTMSKVSRRPGPEFVLIHIPEEHQLRQQVLVLPEYNINIVLGSDYMGEDKKGFLRQAMWYADEHGMLGLHAGTKVVTARDRATGKLKTYGIFLFGLSATGKSTWSCHPLGLNYKDGEDTKVAQDDIVFLKNDGSALGSEVNYFVKTDVSKDLQEAMYNALIHKSALLENVMIDSHGNPDFLDERLCANGRAVIARKQLKIQRGRRKVGIYYKSLDLPSLEELDGLVFAFITRRNTIMSFAQRLTPEQAVLAYLWGESSHSAASEPDKAGQSVRTVGTDPFIIGSRAKKTNRFWDIIKSLEAKYPGKLQYYQYNTGGMGELMEATMEGGVRKVKVIRKVSRVPIPLMAAIQRGDLRGTNEYRKGRLDTEEIVACEGGDLSSHDADKLYSQDQINGYIDDLVEGRRKFTDEIAREGLKPEILKEAEKSFRIQPKKKTVVAVPEAVPKEKAKTEEKTKAEEKPKEKAEESEEVTENIPIIPDWETKSRPKRAILGRYR
jgi:phosphoenolpyruvate carboxykinase (ATP)